MRNKLINPAPASSVFSRSADAGSAAIISWAICRGLALSNLANCSATFQAKSPCWASLGRSSVMAKVVSAGTTWCTACSRSWVSSARASVLVIDMGNLRKKASSKMNLEF